MNKFEKFAEILSLKLDGFNIKFKDESTFMKLLGKILFFNKGFMTSYKTTIWKTVYFTNRSSIEKNIDNNIVLLGHEFVHASDAANFLKFLLFMFIYLSPQILAPFALILMPFNWILSLILFLILLTPIPSLGRTYYEFKAYTMSLFIKNELLKASGTSIEERRNSLYLFVKTYNKWFIASDYYFMWPFGIEKRLKEKTEEILSENILEIKIFADMKKSLQEAAII